MSILVLGTVALDSVQTPFGRRRHMLGGSAAHFSMSARIFTDVNLVAIVGEDFPRKYIQFLNRKGINLSSLIRSQGKTFQWQGRYVGDLNTARTLSTELGVLASFKPVIADKQRDIDNIFLANVDPDIQRHVLGRMRRRRLVGLDSMNYWINHKRRSLVRLLKLVDIYVANDQEARSLSGETNLIQAAKRLRSRGPRIILIKKGEHGVMLYSDEFIFSLPAFPVDKVIDPTGAGDTFAGGFMGYLARARSVTRAALRKAAAYGTVAASFNVEAFGMERTSRLSIRQVDSRLALFKKTVSF